MVDQKGRKPNPLRLGAIKNIPSPTNMPALHAFFGLANYDSNFLPNIHVLRADQNKLIKIFELEL